MLTKKELNAIKAAAFDKFTEQHSNLYPGSSMVYCYRVQEGREVKHILLSAKSQMHHNLLAENGFTDNAEVRLIFEVNRKTRTLTPVSRWEE